MRQGHPPGSKLDSHEDFILGLVALRKDISLHEIAGATLFYLPPYSPDFNPIEIAFSKPKALLRKAAARTVTDLWDVIADAIEVFTPTESENYFSAAGYDRD